MTRNRDLKAAIAAIVAVAWLFGLIAAEAMGWVDIWAAFKSSF